MLCGIPMTRISICDEIQEMVSFLVKNIQSSHLTDWTFFEFITKKHGRRGPSKEECISYYEPK